MRQQQQQQQHKPMVTIQNWYERVNAAWPKEIPQLTETAASNAARKLYRFATGKKIDWRIRIASGNRHTWGRRGVLSINPSKGWHSFLHLYSHWLDRVVLRQKSGPRQRPHARTHAKLELRLIREIVRRGWLDAPVPVPVPVPVPTSAPKVRDRSIYLCDDSVSQLAHANKMLARANRRFKLAFTNVRKWRTKVRRIEKFSE